MILQQFPPMGVYETLFRFADATGGYMGDSGTQPWAQGYPLTTQIPGGPPLPNSIALTSKDLKYPKATGNAALRKRIAEYYNTFYDAQISEDHVAIFAGGRPAIFATMAFLLPDTEIAIERTEYTPYYDVLRVLNKPVRLIASDEQNKFRPAVSDHESGVSSRPRRFLVKSNPCNPTGVTMGEEQITGLLRAYSGDNRGALIDEAYEFYGDPEPLSALACIEDIDQTNFFIIGAATKGLQVPGMRVGWVVASREHIEIFRNFSSFGMGGVSRASQLYVTELMEPLRVNQARAAICSFYASQRERYGAGLAELGFELMTGGGGFYHWGKTPDGISGDRLNERLFQHNAGILPGRLCDMDREPGRTSGLDHFVRFSFGPLPPDSYEGDMTIMQRALD